MSSTIYKSIEFRDNEVIVACCCRNVFPKYYIPTKSNYYTKMLQEKGKDAVILYILQSFIYGTSTDCETYVSDNWTVYGRFISHFYRNNKYRFYGDNQNTDNKEKIGTNNILYSYEEAFEQLIPQFKEYVKNNNLEY